jgi:hypothetical protein
MASSQVYLEWEKQTKRLGYEEERRSTIENLLQYGETYEVWSPYDAFSAEKVLADMLKQHNPHWIFRILSSDVKLK